MKKLLLNIYLFVNIFCLQANAQDSKLTTCAEINTIREIEQYNICFEKIINEKLKNNYIVRFIAKPSFAPEYVFQIAKRRDTYFDLSVLVFCKNLWHVNKNKEINVNLANRVVERNLALLIDTLFELLTENLADENAYGYGEDGVSYYFYRKTKNGLKCGETWSPNKETLLGSVIKICDTILLYTQKKNVDLDNLKQSIELICKQLKDNVK